MVEELLGKIAVWINETDTMAECHVLKDHVAQQSRFAGASLADDIDVVTSINGSNADE